MFGGWHLTRIIQAGLVALVYVTCAPTVRADGIKSPQELLAEFRDYRFHSYLAPNEDQPVELLPILSAAPKGAYLSVGSERGFIGASLRSGISRLILADRDPSVVLFNRLNVALLMVSTHLKDYRHLRFEASATEWRSRAARFPPDVRRLLTDSSAYAFWTQRVRNPSFYYNDADFRTFYRDPRRQPGREFEGANYLYYATQFRRLQRLSKRGLITVQQTDLGQPEQFQHLIEMLKRMAIRIAVCDLSNVPDSLASDRMAETLIGLGPLAAPGAVVVSTHFAYGRQFLYQGHRLDQLLRSPAASSISGLAEFYARSRENALRWAKTPRVREVVAVLDGEAVSSGLSCRDILE